MSDPVNEAVNNLIDAMFDNVLNTLFQIIFNDLTVVVMVMLSLTLILTGSSLIRDFLGMGLNEKEKALKSSYDAWQRNKGTWRGDLYRKKYRDGLRDFDDEPDENEDEEQDRFESGGISLTVQKK